MPADLKNLLQDALALPEEERALLGEVLLASIDRPDPGIDARWAREAEDRLAAFNAGEMKAISAEDVFAEFDGS